MERDNTRFKALLDENYIWPAEFPFKFIVFPHQVDELKGLLNDAEITIRESKNGKYVSVSTSMKMSSSDEVIYIYEKVKIVDGLIAL